MEQRSNKVGDSFARVAGDAGRSDRTEHAVERPARTPETPVPPLPDVDELNPDAASVQYSHYRTGLSKHRTGLSEHRTSLSEYRTDLSTKRTEVSMRRTGMSFQRTRLSADRTLAATIRTSMALITFGFTVSQLFEKFAVREERSVEGAHRFGIALIGLGILMLVIGIIYHGYFMWGLRHERKAMTEAGLIHAESKFPPSMVLITALTLLVIGIVAIFSLIYRSGPFY